MTLTLRLEESPRRRQVGGLAGFTVRSGVAVPNDLSTLGRFQALQRAINAADFTAKVVVDGIIGGDTIARSQELVVGTAPEVEAFVSDVPTLADTVDEVRAAIENSYFLGAISQEPNLSTAAPSLRQRFGSGGGGSSEPEDDEDAGGGLGGGAKIGLLLLGVGAIGLAFLASATEDVTDEEADAMQQAALTGT